jgi:hypothetical protein
LLGTLWADILRPTFKQKTLFLRGAHYQPLECRR